MSRQVGHVRSRGESSSRVSSARTEACQYLVDRITHNGPHGRSVIAYDSEFVVHRLTCRFKASASHTDYDDADGLERAVRTDALARRHAVAFPQSARMSSIDLSFLLSNREPSITPVSTRTIDSLAFPQNKITIGEPPDAEPLHLPPQPWLPYPYP